MKKLSFWCIVFLCFLGGILTASFWLKHKNKNFADIFSLSTYEDEGDFKDGEVLVKFKKNRLDISRPSGQRSLKDFAEVQGVEEAESFDRENISLMKTETDETTDQLVEKLKDDPTVEYVEPNYFRNFDAAPNDTNFSLLWGMNNTGQTVNGTTGMNDADIDAPEAWNTFTGGSTVVAVLDTGVQYTHPDLQNNLWDGSVACKDESNNDVPEGCPNHGWDFVNEDNDPMDDHGHGTHVSGIIGAEGNNGQGVSGVNWHVKIMAVKVGGSNGVLVSDWIRGLNFAKNNGAKVANASFGGGGFSQAEYDAIAAFNGLFIAAAGNNSSNNNNFAFYPAGYNLPNVISVAATNSSDNLASFSNYGSTSVDVGAPGVNIASTYPTSSYVYMSGTSMAAPQVSGEAAMLWGYATFLSTAQTRSIIETSGDTVSGLSGLVATGKRINLFNALNTFQPRGGFSASDLIPANQVNQSTAGDGVVTIHFRLEDGLSGLSFTLKNFEYSTDGGGTFNTPTNGDLSEALSLGWTDNNYISSTDFSGTTYQFALNTKHADVSGFTDTDQSDVEIRFKVNDGTQDSPVIVTEAFRVNNTLPTAILSNTPANEVNGKTADITVGGTNVATYQFSLDAGDNSADTPIATHIQFTNLTNGSHELSVTAKDAQGNTQETPTTFSWTVDSTTPDITGLTDDAVATQSKTWDWDSSEPEATFRFSIDQSANGTPSGDYSAIKTATQSSGDGTYFLHVQSTNSLGNESDVVTVSAVLDNTGPIAVLSGAPSGNTLSTSASISVSGTDVTHYKYSLNNGALSDETLVETPIVLDSLSVGTKRVKVIGRDALGNYQDIGSATQAVWTVVSLTPPTSSGGSVSSGGGSGGSGGSSGSSSAHGAKPSLKPAAPEVIEPRTIQESPQPTVDLTKLLDYANHWAKSYILQLVQEGIVSGCDSKGNFCPDNNISGIENLKIALRSAGIEAIANLPIPKTLSDTLQKQIKNSWGRDYYLTALKLNIIKATYPIDDKVTRGQALEAILNATLMAPTEKATTLLTSFQMLKVDKTLKNPYADLKKTSSFYYQVLFSYQNKITQGYTANGKTEFRPNNFITRAEMAKIAVLVKGL